MSLEIETIKQNSLIIKEDKNTNSFLIVPFDIDAPFYESTINAVRSWAWSSNCRFFYIIIEKVMILGNTVDEDILITKTDPKIIELFVNHQK
jgi:hypothetical protein